jgi:prepilin-type N-terminal cleavage/methylation domain-containing protein
MKKRLIKAFTLIELLVVISIIGLLSALAIVSFAGTQKSARDTTRKSDLRQYQNALEIFANKNNGLYPAESGANGVAASSTLCSDLSETTCPEDPKNADDSSYEYLYMSDGTTGSVDATKYVLWDKLENVSSTTYWVVCSNGKVGEKAGSLSISAGSCPL